jgi:hypothetical protein
MSKRIKDDEPVSPEHSFQLGGFTFEVWKDRAQSVTVKWRKAVAFFASSVQEAQKMLEEKAADRFGIINRRRRGRTSGKE